MRYTVKQLAKISGVSVRTLHWYDSIGLLKPAYIGANNYRYYEGEELLLLQQILFFRELGLPLNDIQKLLAQNDFDKLQALKAHKVVLEQQINRKNQLIDTIDKTILRLEGEQAMTDTELYYGFDSAKQKEYEQYLVEYKGLKAEKLLMESKRRTAKWNQDQWDNVKQEGDAIHKALAELIDKNFSPESFEVQQITHRHYQMIERFYHPTKEVYIGLTELYQEHPDFRKFFEVYHPQMVEFIGHAMRFYAEKNLA
jgi:DNA-binding transcriptional MerR regulator